MPKYVDVNGAMVEADFLAENISEARDFTWEYRTKVPDHRHCMICGVVLSTDGWQSQAGWLCPFCHGRFVENPTG